MLTMLLAICLGRHCGLRGLSMPHNTIHRLSLTDQDCSTLLSGSRRVTTWQEFKYVRAYVIQVCLLDLDYNLPVQVRDQALGADPEDQLPESDVGKEYALAARAADGTLQSNLLTGKPNDTILKLQRTTPYYKVSRGCILL